MVRKSHIILTLVSHLFVVCACQRPSPTGTEIASWKGKNLLAADVDTVLKAEDKDINELNAKQKCDVKKETVLHLKEAPESVSANSFRVHLEKVPEGCPENLTNAYIIGPHFGLDKAVDDKEKTQDPIILMYHDVVASKTQITANDVSKDGLEGQLQTIQELGYTSLSAEDLYAIKSGQKQAPQKSIVLTFDDGYLGNFTYALPLLEKYKIKGIFFVHTDYIGVPTSKEHMSFDQLKEVEASGLVKVYPHTKSHPDLTILGEKSLEEELRGSRKVLEEKLGGTRDFTAYPAGAYNRRVITAAKKYYRMALAVSDHGRIDPLFDATRVRMEKWAETPTAFKTKILKLENSRAAKK